jgi:hypothetical protein
MKQIISMTLISMTILASFAGEKSSDIKQYIGILDGYRWNLNDAKGNNTQNGFDTIDKVNKFLDDINSHRFDIKNGNIKKISNGCFRSDGNISIFLDYSEVLNDTLNYLVYDDPENKMLMVLKNSDYLYFVDRACDTNYIIKLNSVFFQNNDFITGTYSLDNLLNGISGYFITSSIIKRNLVESLYGKNDKSWKRYFKNPEDEEMMFKSDIEDDIKFEVVNLFTGKNYPAKLYPLWMKYTRTFDSSLRSCEFLNELITIPNLYEVFRDRNDNWIKGAIKFDLSKKTKDMLQSTYDNRMDLLSQFEMMNLYNLSKNSVKSEGSEKSYGSNEMGIISANRHLLEDIFPKTCPKSMKLNFVPEDIAGDCDDYIDAGSLALLLKQNLKNDVIIERNKAVIAVENENENENVGSNDPVIAKYKKSLQIKKVLSNVDLIAIDSRCVSDIIFNRDKYEKMEDLIKGSSDFFKSSDLIGKNFDYNRINNMKKEFKLRFYYQSLRNNFENANRDAAYDCIYESLFSSLSRIFDFYDGQILIENKYYDKNMKNDLVKAILKIQYEYIKSNEGKKIDLDAKNWEIPVAFIKIDDNLFTAYFLDYQKK